MLRIDQWPAHNLAGARLLSMDMGLFQYAYTPRAISAVIWHGKDSEGVGQLLAQFMHGRRLLVRYFVASASSRELTFTLEGASSAIGEALQISQPPKASALP